MSDPSSQDIDKQELIRGFVDLLGNMKKEDQETQEDPEDSGWVEDFEHDLGIPGGTIDKYTEYEEIIMDDGRILRRYETGAIRVENPTSGVIQEERPDGSLVVSLPSGKVLLQKFRGEPLLLYDTHKLTGEPKVARVSAAQLPGDTENKFVFHFEDHEGSHLIEIESLRYYRIKTGSDNNPTVVS